MGTWKVAVAEEIRHAPRPAADLFERLPEDDRPAAWLVAILDDHPTRTELDEAERRADHAEPESAPY
ncbi:hypothetical protein [Streptomyces rubrogriseus]|uniref:hypothetical protein n=1 Tax=Streptomyces rubrogriseus TaxID=194673 RepID=UPI003675EFC1